MRWGYYSASEGWVPWTLDTCPCSQSDLRQKSEKCDTMLQTAGTQKMYQGVQDTDICRTVHRLVLIPPVEEHIKKGELYWMLRREKKRMVVQVES